MAFQGNTPRGRERQNVETMLTGGTIVVVVCVVILLFWTLRHPTSAGPLATPAATATPAGPTVIAVPTITPAPPPPGVQNL